MAGHSEWYPSGQVCYPPELPLYLKHVYDLKPVVGVPRDDEVIEIHAVVQAAHRASGIPGMHDPGLFMKIADHLFNVQMAQYRNKYSLITFPSNATYTPPALPAHVSVKLEPVAGAPSDEEIIKAQDAMRVYQQFSNVPAMFDPRVNMELSQHLFNIQMARYMRDAGQSLPNLAPQATTRPKSPIQAVEQAPDLPERMNSATKHSTPSGDDIRVDQTPQLVPGVDVRELVERSNQLADQFNQLMERFNELAERPTQPTIHPDSLLELFNQALVRFTQFADPTQGSMEYSNLLAERFNHLFERFNEMVKHFNQPTQQVINLAERSNQILQQSNQLAERHNQLLEDQHPVRRSNELSERANQLAQHLAQSTERSNQLAEQANKHAEHLGDVMQNINRVLVGVQHAIVRNHQGNTENAIYCLVNEAGEKLGVSETTHGTSFRRMFGQSTTKGVGIPIKVDGIMRNFSVPQPGLGECLRFFRIGIGLCVNQISTDLIEGKQEDAEHRLSDYLTSCLV